jgi:hypothetical protein
MIDARATASTDILRDHVVITYGGSNAVCSALQARRITRVGLAWASMLTIIVSDVAKR